MTFRAFFLLPGSLVHNSQPELYHTSYYLCSFFPSIKVLRKKIKIYLKCLQKKFKSDFFSNDKKKGLAFSGPF